MAQWIWLFLIYGFLGWCTEVVFAAVNEGKFVNRGFLNGPICPIYGFGMVLVSAVLGPVAHRPLLLYVGSVILTTLLEFVTGFVLEKVFHEKWWDYSQEPLNFKGYICLKFSLLWGIGCLLVMDLFHEPLILPLVAFLTRHLVGTLLLWGLLLYLAVDLTLTVIALTRLKSRITRLEAAEAELRKLSDGIGERLYRGAEQAIEFREKVQPGVDRLQAQVRQRQAQVRQILREKESISQRRLYAAFPRLKTRLRREDMSDGEMKKGT